VKFAAFYYPGYYSCPVRNEAAGNPIDEWKLLQGESVSVFVATEPIQPALGYTDCSNPNVLAEEASLAAAHGVDAFIFNYYFDGKYEELAAPIDTFAGINTEVEFALNICCHMPKRKLPFGVHDTDIAPFVHLTEQQFHELADDLARRFFGHRRYLRRDGCVVLTMYHVNALVLLYGPEGLRKRLAIFRDALLEHGLNMYLIGLYSVAGGWSHQTLGIDELPFDSFSCYVALPDFESCAPVQHYMLAAEKSLQAMRVRSSCGRSVVVCVGAGWNATPRGAPDYDPKIHGLSFPYYPIIVGDQPAAFEHYLRKASEVALADPSFLQDLLFLGPWNEWTEGCYLLPDTRYGLAKLEAVRRVKDALKASM
jgi:hypothetical protein